MAEPVLHPSPRTAPAFLVTGAGRCGTHYLCAALNALGFATGHEAVFAYDESAAGAWGAFVGDCSWPGAAYPHRLAPGSPVLHLMRDPLAMVRSRLGDNNLGFGSDHRTVASFVARHRPDVARDAPDDLGRAILFVARWNALVASIEVAFPRLPFRRARIEDVSRDPDELASTVAFLTGRRPSLDDCGRVLDGLDDRVGSRGNRASVSWSDVEAHPCGCELIELAARWGYR